MQLKYVQLHDALKTLLALEQLEFYNKNLLAGTDESRSLYKQEELQLLINKVIGLDVENAFSNQTPDPVDPVDPTIDGIKISTKQDYMEAAEVDTLEPLLRPFVTKAEDVEKHVDVKITLGPDTDSSNKEPEEPTEDIPQSKPKSFSLED